MPKALGHLLIVSILKIAHTCTIGTLSIDPIGTALKSLLTSLSARMECMIQPVERSNRRDNESMNMGIGFIQMQNGAPEIVSKRQFEPADNGLRPFN
ncbi:hypothetical protein ASE94_06535 [Devosia sp. Leaf64]|nr:hypothetical protein ASE94_06535 [Devosia sp. Leaf64]